MALTMVNASNFDDGQDAVGSECVAEWQNILDNALQLISPWTGNMNAGGNRLISLSVGTVSAPAISPQADTSTGIWFPGVSTVAIAATGLPVASFSAGAGAVNYLSFTSAPSGSAAVVAAIGADPSVTLVLSAKTSGSVQFWTQNVARWMVDDSGVLRSAADANYDFGYNGRPRDIWASRNINAATFYATAGTALAPTYSFITDIDSGFYSPSDGAVALTLNGAVQGIHAVSYEKLVYTNAGASGMALILYHNSASPAASDAIGIIEFHANSDAAAERTLAQIYTVLSDPAEGSLDSQINFVVSQGVVADAGPNTTAFIDNAGAWHNASIAINKRYIDSSIDKQPIMDQLSQLSTLGVYVGSNVPDDKMASAHKHYSPTAEEFYATFGLGSDKGIAPSDVAWLAIKGLLELSERVATLESAQGSVK